MVGRVPRLLAISDRRTLVGEDLSTWAARLGRIGVDAIQIREKDLSDAALYREMERCVARAGRACSLLVNGRCDVSFAVGAAGVHLPGDSVPTGLVRRRFPDLVVGVSAHSEGDVRRAQDDGADYATLSPIFAPRSKTFAAPPLGLGALESAARSGLPILALGGIETGSLSALADAGAVGVAAISLFRENDVAGVVAAARELWPKTGDQEPSS